MVAEHVSKWTEASLISNEETESADRVLFEKFVIFCGVTWDVYSDQDRVFEYALFQQLSATCYEGNTTESEVRWMVERFNRPLKATISLFLKDN